MIHSASQQLAQAERHFRAGQAALAEDLLRKVIARDPGVAKAYELLAYICGNRQDLASCEEYLEKAAALPQCSPEALFYLGRAQLKRGRASEAVESLGRAMKLAGEFFEGLHELGVAHGALGAHESALRAYRRAERLHSRSRELQSNLADTLAELRQFGASLQHYDRALAIDPKFDQAWANRGTVLTELGRHAEALESYERALALAPEDIHTRMNRAATLVALKRHAESLACFDEVLRLAPETQYLRGQRLHAAMFLCQWDGWSQQVDDIVSRVVAGEKAVIPFEFIPLPASAATLLKCAHTYAQDKHPLRAPAAVADAAPRDPARKLRVGYFSTDFREHPVSQLLARVLECHDRDRFEWFGFALGSSARDETGARIATAFDHFSHVADRSDEAIAALARDAGIDIAVDLNGYTEGARSDIFAWRAAPVQVNYLGFPGTMGCDYMDYIVADATIIPPDEYACYSEKVVVLPGSYQPNDNTKRIAEAATTREDEGLPPIGFVFACFNNTFKVTPDVFDVWMRLLRNVPGSVLWLFQGNAEARRAMESEARQRDVEPERIVWAPRVPQLEDHLARHAHADLFLDTFHYNAHTTASDALWSGLPVLTLAGKTFASRVGASLLNAVGLPELVTHSVDEYEALALSLATSPQRLAELRARLQANRKTSPLFDSPLFARRMEAAYEAMWDRHQRGLAPDHIRVANED